MLLTALALAVVAAGQGPADWHEPFPAHKVIGNVYYVGSKDLATYLVTTPKGHILINSGFDRTVPLIQKSVESLGFKMTDVKILLASHAHSDHVAGLARLQQLTGAKVFVMRGDDRVIASGGKGQYLYTTDRWDPCKVDRVLQDRDEVKLGDVTLVARLTPGHTRGCTTWTWKVSDGGTQYDVVVIGSPNVNPGFQLVNNKEYPEIADDFARTFEVLKSLPCDVFLGAHGSYYGMVERHALLKKGKANPFVDPRGYKEYVALKERAFRKTLAAQQDKLYDVKRDIPYADSAHKRQVLDVYSPKKAKNLPVVFWIHGGGWQTGDKASVQMKPKVFVDKGFVFVSTNYRLLPTVEMGTIVRDVARSIRWVHDHIAEYGGDPKRLFVMGHSAGAQLAALICTDGRYLKAERLSLAIIKGCVPVDGDTYDVPAIIETAETRWRVHGLPRAKFGHREKFGNDPAKHRDFSAVTHVAKDKGIPPFLILHVAGHPDTTAQALRLGNVLKAAGVPATVFGARETTHNKINADLGLPDDPATQALFEFLGKILKTSAQEPPSGKADREKLARSPRKVAEQLAAVYGKKLDQVAYIPALPLIAKLHLGERIREPGYAEEVRRIVAPFLRGEKSSVPRSGSEQAGHLIFAELAQRSKGKERERWTLLCRSAADQIFGKDGKPLPLMPYHNEMSDAVFMAGPILAATGRLTGERKYFDAAATHFASMRKLCVRPDGLYRHSPLCEAAWGRGNGFPALGLALALSDWPDDHPAKKGLIAEFQKHMAALLPQQDAKTGCWHQVIDRPDSYDEYSCTCMIGFAMQRGIRRGWLKADYQASVDKAWRAVKERTGADGKLVNVCAGTGKQKTLRAYLERPAINGRDDRGGAMGLLFATELLASMK